MLPSLLHTVSFVCVLSAPACVSAVATETVVGVAGQVVTLPCRLESAKQSDVEVCWGRGKPSLFTCHNTLISAAGDHVTYQTSERVSVSSSTSSLSIFDPQLSDSGFYHCRVQLPGLFNDQTFSVHLIMILPRSGIPEQLHEDTMRLRDLQTTTKSFLGGDITEKRGSDVTEPEVALVQSPVLQEPVNTLQVFVGNTLRLAFIIFIPALLLTASYRVWSSETDRRPDQSEEEDSV